MSHPPVEKRHLIRPTTFRTYFEERVGPISGVPSPLREQLQEREDLLAGQMQPGDELYEWGMTGDDCGDCTGLAVVRAGEIVWTQLCARAVRAHVGADSGTPTTARFYEAGQPASANQLQRSSFQSQVHTPLRPDGVMKRIVLDPTAPTSDVDKPAFMTPPSGAEAYHGFPLLESTRREGWCLGAITDPFEADTPEGCTIGDLFVEAPDGSRAGLVWNVDPQPRFAVLQPPNGRSWGLFHFTFPRPVRTVSELEEVFGDILPVLKRLYTDIHRNGDS
ncbi:MAG: hypothetical protein U0941_13210 [Planctomycetaceae bacterium]